MTSQPDGRESQRESSSHIRKEKHNTKILSLEKSREQTPKYQGKKVKETRKKRKLKHTKNRRGVFPLGLQRGDSG